MIESFKRFFVVVCFFEIFGRPYLEIETFQNHQNQKKSSNNTILGGQMTLEANPWKKKK